MVRLPATKLLLSCTSRLPLAEPRQKTGSVYAGSVTRPPQYGVEVVVGVLVGVLVEVVVLVGVDVLVAVRLAVLVCVGVLVIVGVFVFVAVFVGVLVLVGVLVIVAVLDGVGVKVLVANPGDTPSTAEMRNFSTIACRSARNVSCCHICEIKGVING